MVLGWWLTIQMKYLIDPYHPRLVPLTQGWAITGPLIASPFMNTTAKDDFPFDLFGILSARKITKGLAKGGATTLGFGQFMDLFD